MRRPRPARSNRDTDTYKTLGNTNRRHTTTLAGEHGQVSRLAVNSLFNNGSFALGGSVETFGRRCGWRSKGPTRLARKLDPIAPSPPCPALAYPMW